MHEEGRSSFRMGKRGEGQYSEKAGLTSGDRRFSTDIDIYEQMPRVPMQPVRATKRFDGALLPEISVEVASRLAPIFVRLRKTVMVSVVKYRMVMQ